jgi:hypothetical protein
MVTLQDVGRKTTEKFTVADFKVFPHFLEAQI